LFHRHFHGRRPHAGHTKRFAWGEHYQDGLRHGHPRREGRGGRSRLGRFFAHGDLRLVILHLISEKPRHGYELIKAIEERVAGAYSPSPGAIYPTLTLLEELGYIAIDAAGEGARKLHAITAQGRAYLDANRPALEALLARMEQAGRAQGGELAARVVHAMKNLKRVIRLRLAQDPLTEAQAEAMAAAIDAAATSVERIR
jgi:DNA-binding PadR family transcriptional regulator